MQFNYGLGMDSGVGSYDPYETEEERKKREAASNILLGKQEVETYADGSQTIKTTQELPAAPAISPLRVRPVQEMPVAQPVAPVVPETFNRMLQVESGNRDFDAQGRPITSPKGAMFASQVMPATAAQPGFGVRPAAAQTPEEYNRVGRDYFSAMTNLFGGDQQKAAAAYNAGPGRVQQAERQAAEQGGSWTDYLPKETLGYIGKVFDRVIPSAQAATVPEMGAGAGRGTMGMPQAVPGEGVAVATGQGVQGTMTTPQSTVAQQQAIYTGQAPQAQTSAGYISTYQEVQDDPERLLALRGDQSAPEWLRRRAGERAYELMNAEVKRSEAEQRAQQLAQAAAQGDRRAGNTIAKELQTQEGSWLKMILLGFISPQLAGEEAIKLGFGNKWTQTTDMDGKPVLLQTNARGLPLKGYDSAGKELPQEQLVAIGGQAVKKDLDIVGGSFVNDKTGEVGRLVTDKRTGQSFIQTDTGRKPMSGFRPQSATGTLADMRSRAIQDLNVRLQGKGIEEQMAILRPYNQQLISNGFPPVQPSEVGINVPQVGAAAAQAVPAMPAGGVAGPVAPGAAPGMAPAAAVPSAAPGVAPVVPGARPTATQMEAMKTQATTEAKARGEDIATATINQGRNEATADYLITKIDELFADDKAFRDSVGIKGAGLLFGARETPIAGTKEADWMARFSEVKGQSFLQAIENLKGMGALSNMEGEAATKAIQRMNQSQSEEEFRKAAEDFQNVIRRGIDRTRGKLGQEPKYGTKPESEIAAERRQATPMTPAEKARAELERRRKEQRAQ